MSIMKQLLLLTSFLLLQAGSKAQINDWGARDSVKITFTQPKDYIGDQATVPLWQIGRTHKSYFTTDTNGVVAIMTDTAAPYPTSAANYFVIKAAQYDHTLIKFWHRYQSDSGKDGGTVDYSLDKGLTWNSVFDSCNFDTAVLGYGGIFTEGFFGSTDTLPDGTPAFSGNSGGTRISKVQFKNREKVKSTTQLSCDWEGVDTFYLRFRFISDTIPDTLAGWMIDSILVKHFWTSGETKNALSVTDAVVASPNPSPTGVFYLRRDVQISGGEIEITDMSGRRVLVCPYKERVDLANMPRGLYFYRVFTNSRVYTGKLVYE